MRSYRNSEHYCDPTSGQALDNITQERRLEARKLIRKLRRLAESSGFSIAERVVLVDRITGQIYR